MVRTLLLSASPIIVTWGAAHVKKMTLSWKFTFTTDMNKCQGLRAHPIIYLVSKIYWNTKVYNWWSYVDIVTHIFRVNIFNVCTIFIWINPTCIMPNLYQTTLKCDRAIGPTRLYRKSALIWRFKHVYSALLLSITLSPTL